MGIRRAERSAKVASGKLRSGCGVGIVVLFVFAILAVVARIAPWTGPTLALVRVEGPIYESRELVHAMTKAAANPRVRGILVRIDSPGGAVGASEEIYRELSRIRTESKKPVVASMGNIAASGGYYVSLAADEIFANNGTVTGSIGVIATDLDIEQLLAALRIRPNVIKSGEHKDTGSPLRAMTEEERQLLQRLVFDLHRQFVREVVQRRQEPLRLHLKEHPQEFEKILATSATKVMDRAIERSAFDSQELAREVGTDTAIVDRVKSLADGRVFTGEQAWRLGLVDKIGNIEDARRRLAALAGLSKEARLVDYSPGKGIVQWLATTGERAWAALRQPPPAIEYRFRGH